MTLWDVFTCDSIAKDPINLQGITWENVEEWYDYVRKGGLRTFDNRWSNNKTYDRFVYRCPYSKLFHVAIIDARGRIFLSSEWRNGGQVSFFTENGTCLEPINCRDY